MVTTLTRLARLVAVALLVTTARLVLGPWPTAVLLAGGGLWWGLRAWHRMENRPRHRASSRALVPDIAAQAHRRAGPGHVTFARALAAVALMYLDRCEQEADQP